MDLMERLTTSWILSWPCLREHRATPREVSPKAQWPASGQAALCLDLKLFGHNRHIRFEERVYPMTFARLDGLHEFVWIAHGGK